MSNDFSIFVVDDSETQRLLIEAAFGDGFVVESFESAEKCLERLGDAHPDLFLLDVEMPGLDGYELCRRIKDDPATANIPAMFVSSHTDLESRLHGYDSGGEDFIAKPIDMAEVRQKVAAVRRSKEERAGLAERLAESDLLSSMILSNLDEYAVLIKFLRQLNTCANVREIAEALLGLLRAYRLDGAVQLRLGSTELTLSEEGEDRPLEVAVINHVRDVDRIFEFHKRLAVNFERITTMINNMPIEDADFCGRIRDHIAIAVESADAKVGAMLTAAAHARTRNDISQVLQQVVAAVDDFRTRYERVRYESGLLSEEMAEDLSAAFASLALTTEHEEQILDIVRSKAQRLREMYDFGNQTQATLKNVSDQLAQTLAS